jgi:hypothetical protein
MGDARQIRKIGELPATPGLRELGFFVHTPRVSVSPIAIVPAKALD